MSPVGEGVRGRGGRKMIWESLEGEMVGRKCHNYFN